MNVLALDTSGATGSVALITAAGAALEETFGDRGRHEAVLLPASRRLFAQAGIVPSDLQAVAVGMGPGSYTGVRIAVSFAKTLVFALHRPLVGISGLAALAWNARSAGGVIAVLEPGHAGRIYAGAFEVSGPLPDPVLPVDLWDVADFLAALPPGAVLTGGEAERHGGVASARSLRRIAAPEGGFRVPALTLARIGAAHLALGRAPSEPFALEPLYLQPAAPERTR